MTTATQTHPDMLSAEDEEYYRQQWQTPDELFNWISEQVKRFGIYGFGIDVAAEAHNKKLGLYICPPESGADIHDLNCFGRDGLHTRWNIQHAFRPYETAAWFNPPFGLTKDFMPKAYEEARRCVFSVGLTQTDTTAAWWQDAKQHATARIDLYPRVQFIQHPKLLAHMKATGKRPSGNPGGNSVWIFNPYDLDRPGGCQVVDCGPWR